MIGRRGCALRVMLSAVVLAAPAARGTDLWQVYTLAVASDPAFQSARFALDAAKERRPEARSALLPKVTASANGGRTSGSTRYTDTPEVSRSFHSHEWVVELAQPVFRADSLLLLDEAHSVEAQATAQFDAAQQDLMLRVAQAYFDVVVAERAVEAAAAQVQSLNEQLAAATQSFSKGVSSISDVDDSRSRAAQAQATQVSAANDLDSRRATLESMTGAPLQGGLAFLSATVQLPEPTPRDVSAWTTRAVDSNPAVIAARAALAVGEDEMRRAQALRLPVVDLVASYGDTNSSGNINYPVDYGTHVRDTQVSLRLSVPILDGGGMHAQVGEARAHRNRLQEELRAARNESALNARISYSAILSGVSQVQALQSALDAATSAVKGNRIGYGLGLRINSDVLNAQQQLYGTRRDLDKARYDTLIAGLKLKASTGSLEESDLQEINGLLSEGRDP